MARLDPLRPMRWRSSDNGNSIYDYRCRCGWKIEATRYSEHYWEFTDPDYGFRPNGEAVQRDACCLIDDHRSECPAR